MFGAGSQAKTGEMVEVTTVEGIKKLQKAADKVHANGGKVVGTIVCTSPWILDNLEPYCDALTAQYTTSAASVANAYSAQVDVIVGNYNPTGKLSVTMVACEDVIALTEKTLEDGTVIEECASPTCRATTRISTWMLTSWRSPRPAAMRIRMPMATCTSPASV